MEAVLLKCPPYARFHFGITGLDENSSLHQTSERLHSDTLFSVLMVLCSKIFPNQIDDLKAAFESGEVSISSGSYYLEITEYETLKKITQRQIFFLPKPECFELLNTDADKRKELRKIKFVSKGVWERGLLPEDWLMKDSECVIIQGKFVALLSELTADDKLAKQVANSISIFEEKTAPKIADHNRRRENNIFFQTDLCFAANFLKDNDGKPLFQIMPHFYFLIEHRADSQVKNLVETLIEILPDEGIGGGISTGCGKIDSSEIIPFDWQFSEGEKSSKYNVSASLISPVSKADLTALVGYKVMTRGGRRLSISEKKLAQIPENKREEAKQLARVKMIREGALLQLPNEVTGQLVPLHDFIPNYRNGKAFCLPIHQKIEAHETAFRML